jgi:SAM-dependent methyltransferase
VEEQEYVIGTGDAEIERLQLQHTVWRADAMAAWRAAGFTGGQALLDVGCGPGWATLDLADLTGPGGRVVGVDQSARFLGHLRAQCRARRLQQVQTLQAELGELALEAESFDGAWIRWVLAFVPNPRDALRRVVEALRPGAAIAIHEYFDYRTWRVVPRDADFEAFVAAVMSSWRARGGEPDIALSLPGWLEEMGLQIRAIRTVTDLAGPRDDRWRWPLAFADTAVGRLLELGEVDRVQAERMTAAITRARQEGRRMVTPGVAEIIAVRG